MTEWEVWTVAVKLMKDHGDIAAEEEAFNRGKALQSAGDDTGYQVWLAIGRKIVGLNLEKRTATRQ